jgi:two-component system, chemotaxis family, response regulator Rcp1
MKEKNRPFNVLLVEDNPGDVRLTKEAFREGKLSVNLSVATDGVEAMDFLDNVQNGAAPMPDLILLDLNLPKKDGREVLQEIKSNPKLLRIPVIVLTTSSAEQDINRCYDLHVNCYINKPVNLEDFFDVIEKIEHFWLNTAVLPL